MSDYEDLATKKRKISRLEREQEKIRIAQANIDRLLVTENEKQRKWDTRRKILLGTMLQRMIADGIVRAETFTKYSQTMTNRDKQVVEDYWAGLEQGESKD